VESTSGTRRPLGVVLLEGGVVSEAEVESALAGQQQAGKRLGEILLERDLISSPLLARVLAQQNGIASFQRKPLGSMDWAGCDGERKVSGVGWLSVVSVELAPAAVST
jgi:hypothetical protein